MQKHLHKVGLNTPMPFGKREGEIVSAIIEEGFLSTHYLRTLFFLNYWIIFTEEVQVELGIPEEYRTQVPFKDKYKFKEYKEEYYSEDELEEIKNKKEVYEITKPVLTDKNFNKYDFY